tara:strand:+ start:813 stop:1169 length:357 start_codon:yes stop_codon:yes gene_type:complete
MMMMIMTMGIIATVTGTVSPAMMAIAKAAILKFPGPGFAKGAPTMRHTRSETAKITSFPTRLLVIAAAELLILTASLTLDFAQLMTLGPTTPLSVVITMTFKLTLVILSAWVPTTFAL